MSSSSDNSDQEMNIGENTSEEEVDSDGLMEENESTSEDEDPEEESEQDDQERVEIREELKTMSFEDLIKLKEKLGSKVYNEAVFGVSKPKVKKNRSDYKRVNHNRPMEISSKRQVPFGLGGRPKHAQQEIVDPRFNANCGEYDSATFKQRYEFVNEMREKELVELKSKLKKSTDPKEAKKLKFLIQRTNNQLVEEKKRIHKTNEEREEKEKRKAEGGNKKPFYVKKSEKKAQDLVKKYLELKNSGKLEKHLEKRRKKAIAKDRKKYDFD